MLTLIPPGTTNSFLVIANLSTRLSAVKILQSRLQLIQAYLSQISQDQSADSSVRLSHTLIRNIYSLLVHLSVINPSTSDAFSFESLSQANDVALIGLLGSLSEGVQQMREMGKRWAVTRAVRQNNASQEMHSVMQKRMAMGDDIFQGRRGMM